MAEQGCMHDQWTPPALRCAHAGENSVAEWRAPWDGQLYFTAIWGDQFVTGAAGDFGFTFEELEAALRDGSLGQLLEDAEPNWLGPDGSTE